MYARHENVNILTATLVRYGIAEVVTCPGSRNAPLVHNFQVCPQIRCVAVTDERSAGFYALGMAQALQRPVAVCVTSGSALLNLLPAVAEAFYQKVPIVVISADRPPQWIGQQEGQTVLQSHAMQGYVACEVSLSEINNDEQRWFAERLCHEALLKATAQHALPVHINVPLSEPLFDFTVPQLPQVRKVSLYEPRAYADAIEPLRKAFVQAQYPIVVVGQMPPTAYNERIFDDVNALFLHEALSPGPLPAPPIDEMMDMPWMAEYLQKADFLLYLGGHIVSKRLRQALRRLAGKTRMWTATMDRRPADTFMGLTDWVTAPPTEVMALLGETPQPQRQADTLVKEIRQWTEKWHEQHDMADISFSQEDVVRYLNWQLTDMEEHYHVHYANSTAIRLANRYAQKAVWCNRGVNGIDGSLSTAAGFSLAVNETVICVTGDLGFFYDQNALWNNELRGNLRILLINDGGGNIFRTLKGLEKSPARQMVAGEHHTSAQGVCAQYDIGYLRATNVQEMQQAIVAMVTRQANRPMLVEVMCQ